MTDRDWHTKFDRDRLIDRDWQTEIDRHRLTERERQKEVGIQRLTERDWHTYIDWQTENDRQILTDNDIERILHFMKVWNERHSLIPRDRNNIELKVEIADRQC